MRAAPRRKDLLWLAALAAGWISLWAYADPRGDFPLNDDFQYAESARRLLSGGGLRLSQWSQPAALPQILLGAGAGALAGGASNGLLRGLNLDLGIVTILLLFLYMRWEGVDRPRAAAAAGMLGANPIFLAMSGSFHTDLPALFFLLAALWALRLGQTTGRARWLAAASALIALAALERQMYALSAAGAAWLLRREGRLDRRRAAALLGPIAAIAAFFVLWYYGVHGPTWAWRTQQGRWAAPRALLSGGFWLAALLRLDGILQTGALLLLPAALAGLPALRELPRPARREWLCLAAAAGLAAWGILAFDGLPLLENTLRRRGLGLPTLNAPEAKCADLWSWPPLWRLADLAALACALCLTRLAFSAAGARGRAALALCLPPALLPALLPAYFDRYLLPAWAGAGAALWLSRGERLRPALAGAVALAMALVSAVGLRDYYAWNRTRWDAGMAAVRAGLEPGQVENGFDWDGQFTMERNMERLLRERPPWAIGPWSWMTLNRIAVVTSFSPEPPEGFVPAGWADYSTPLCRGAARVYLHRVPIPRGGGN